MLDPAGTGTWSFIKGVKQRGVWPFITDATDKVSRTLVANHIKQQHFLNLTLQKLLMIQNVGLTRVRRFETEAITNSAVIDYFYPNRDRDEKTWSTAPLCSCA